MRSLVLLACAVLGSATPGRTVAATVPAPSAATSPLPPAAAAPLRGRLAHDSTRCLAALRFVRDTQRMSAEVEVDTVDDWRTRQRLEGCRITAAGTTALGVGAEAARFFERLRAHGWTRTPDSRDAPNESSLRFRYAGTDCLFNVYEGARLFTEAEFRVNDAVSPRAGEARYQALVQCLPAMDAAPR